MRMRAIGLAAGLAVAGVAALRLMPAMAEAQPAQVMPSPVADVPPGEGMQTAVLSGGCFWGVQGVFEHVKGVQRVVSGYAGGTQASADYETVSSGSTGHAESVRIDFDPKQISYGGILQVFFSVALDPTERNRQGPDSGTQYRSEVFYATPEQQKVAEAYIAHLDQAHVFARPIATRVDPLRGFYPAEAYHQDYLVRHPDSMYIVMNDLPKVDALKHLFPERYRDTPVLVAAPPS